ncbi:MAG: amidohydrolase family protein [Armatimonadota bacterium]|nr:amidohydrolase family protein [Armatimonadota bacterium]
MRPVLYLNASVHADGGPGRTADALVVVGGRVVAVGDADEVTEAFPRVRRVDLLGLPVFPGFIDAHIHVVGYGLGLLQVELREARSLAGALRLIAAAERRGGPGEWLQGRGWDKNGWPEDRFPTRYDLDAVTGDRPAVCTSKDGHLLWVNTAALRAAGITRDTPDPPGGAISRDAAGEPDGLLKEDATLLVRRVIPAPSPETLEQAAVAAQADAHRLGLTGAHAFVGPGAEGPDQFGVLHRLRARGALTLRIVACVPDRLLDAAAASGLRTGLGDEVLRVGPLKIFADGTLGSQTASMLAPFDGQPGNVGIMVRTPGEIDDLVRRGLAAGLWSAVHAIGDRANRNVLDVFARHREASHRAGARHRIEHVQVLHPDDLPRLAALGVTASMQPIHATADRDAAERYWGARCRYAYAWRSLAASGAVLAFGSDAPVETPDPWRGLYAAVTRRREGDPRPSWYPNECLSLHDAIRAYTAGPAYAAGTEVWQGALAPGMVADFVVLDRDPYDGGPEDLLRVSVLATVVGGRVVHSGGALRGLDGVS